MPRSWPYRLRYLRYWLSNIMWPSLRHPWRSAKRPPRPLRIFDRYVTAAPHPQQALDIFQDEWTCALPPPFAALEAGTAWAFEDQRIEWGVNQLGGVTGKTVLELGPLEGGHSYMLERLGAATIIAIEANPRAYLKCLIIKEILGLQRVRFLCGNFVEYLRTNRITFDLCVASGVLYHTQNPVELLERISQASDRVLLWTHYYDHDIVSRNPYLANIFSPNVTATYAGFRHTLYRYNYRGLSNLRYFCGGSAPFGNWLNRADLLAGLQHFGWHDIEINFEHPEHPNGPCLALVAVRRGTRDGSQPTG